MKRSINFKSNVNLKSHVIQRVSKKLYIKTFSFNENFNGGTQYACIVHSIRIFLTTEEGFGRSGVI